MITYVLLATVAIAAIVPNLFLRVRLLAEIRETYQLLDTLLCSMGAMEIAEPNGHHVRQPDQLAAIMNNSMRKRSE